MVGDLIFIDFEKERGEKSPSRKTESKEEKIKRLAAQVESGEYRVDTDKLAEILVDEVSGELEPE